MKYVILLGDGMADEPQAVLNGKTPLEHAYTPFMDEIAVRGETGLLETVPDGLPPGSDVANLSAFGYDPRACYSGRSPLEAASMGVSLGPRDVAFRLNLICLEEDGEGRTCMRDFSAGHISTEEAQKIIATLSEKLGGSDFDFYSGISYRHLMVWHNGFADMRLVPPHDISRQPVADFLPQGEGGAELLKLMKSRSCRFRYPVKDVQTGIRFLSGSVSLERTRSAYLEQVSDSRYSLALSSAIRICSASESPASCLYRIKGSKSFSGSPRPRPS